MNNSKTSVTNKKANGKVEGERKSRQASYKGKFGNLPHMIIPQEDSEFIENQTASVMKLWLQCWRADPFGDREMQLNHTLSYKSFMRAKKVIEEAGMFMFRPVKSKLNHKETVCWKVQNLHGARRNDFWLKSQGQECPNKGQESPFNGQECPLEGQECPSDNSETYTQQEVQNPSESDQEGVSNSCKELLYPLTVKNKGCDRDRIPPLDGANASAPRQDKKASQNLSVSQFNTTEQPTQRSKTQRQNSQALNKNSTKESERNYKIDRWSTDATKRTIAQNLAIDAQKSTPEYKKQLSDASAQIRAKLERKKLERLSDRAKRLTGKD